MPATYDLGDSIRLTFTVRDIAGTLVDATTVSLAVTRPDATIFTPLTPTHPGVGTYQATLSPDAAGTWLYRWVATGTAVTSEDGQFRVTPNAAANVYTTLGELKARLSIPATDTQDDEELQRVIESESREIDHHCQRHFWTVTETRTMVPTDLWCLHLGGFGDLVSVTTLKTDASGDGIYETTWAAADYQLLCADGTPNVNAGPEPRPYTQIRAVGSQTFPWPTSGRRADLVQIVGVWGWPAVPSGVRDACMILATELFALKDTKFGATSFADLGIIRVRDNPKVLRLLGPYQRAPVLMA